MAYFLEMLGAALVLVSSSVFIAQKAEAQPLPENTIYLVKNGEKKPLLFPGKAFWELKNDKTER
ncbi:MAG: hypothetical protein EB120_07350, partial [Proteobacteria bacterium]|nr:hypothetical protein [Pseudomonadota bacterium]